MLEPAYAAIQDMEKLPSDKLELLSMMHDLSNVLNKAQRYAKLLASEIPESNPLRIYVESIKSNLDRIYCIQNLSLKIIERE